MCRLPSCAVQRADSRRGSRRAGGVPVARMGLSYRGACAGPLAYRSGDWAPVAGRIVMPYVRTFVEQFFRMLRDLLFGPEFGGTFWRRLVGAIFVAHVLGESVRYLVVNPLLRLAELEPFELGDGVPLLLCCSLALGLLWYFGRAAWLYCFGFSLGPGGLRGRASVGMMFRPDRLSIALISHLPAWLVVPWLVAAVLLGAAYAVRFLSA